MLYKLYYTFLKARWNISKGYCSRTMTNIITNSVHSSCYAMQYFLPYIYFSFCCIWSIVSLIPIQQMLRSIKDRFIDFLLRIGGNYIEAGLFSSSCWIFLLWIFHLETKYYFILTEFVILFWFMNYPIKVHFHCS